MFTVGIDVGVLTGIAVLNEDETVYYHATVTVKMVQSPAFNTVARHANLSSHVCIEYPEPDVVSRTAELVEAIELFNTLFPGAHRVRPGVWKNAAICLKPLPANVRNIRMTPHEKDAINIARWYQWFLEHEGR